ncbi:hypothetical protein [Streptomyces pacificus]|uniref:Uncharacterized protein n=1 Tax=Streptomyces pacificus TaxID=2705029 RepID=A0A6A0AW63_9ACTN|nr:hypothetical protein [Streptomyces pacificus]GFH36603.1 hypothetical protein SCWH03_28340 [Streptomyces pacificus]
MPEPTPAVPGETPLEIPLDAVRVLHAVLGDLLAGTAPAPGGVRDQIAAAVTAAAGVREVTPGYCGHCGRGDCSPTADQWLAERRRAEQAEAEATTTARVMGALHRSAEEAVTRVIELAERWASDPNRSDPYRELRAAIDPQEQHRA